MKSRSEHRIRQIEENRPESIKSVEWFTVAREIV
jgi:hypothetical protein